MPTGRLNTRAHGATTALHPSSAADAVPEPTALALVVLWCAADPGRVGDVAPVGGGGTAYVLGRDVDPREPAASGEAPLAFFRLRPGTREARPALTGKRISRRQLRIVARGDVLLVEIAGRCPVAVNGEPCSDSTALSLGDTLLIEGELLLLCARRTAELAPLAHFPAAALGPFGAPDAHGLVGESEPAWVLREDLAFTAKTREPALLVGEAGSGKALAARAIHALSARAAGPFVAASCAALSPTLADAEIFGNVASWPHAGAPDRPGLFSEAAGGTLLLEDLDELPAEVQRRVLTSVERGTMRRAGATGTQALDVRLVASVANLDALDPEVGGCFRLCIELPRLEGRREDLPHLVAHALRRALPDNAPLVGRFLPDGGPPRVDARLVDALAHHAFRAEVRELEAELWRSMRASKDDVLVPSPSLTTALRSASGASRGPSAGPSSEPVSRHAPTPPGASRPPESPGVELAREGDVWRVARGGASVRVRHAKGLAYLDHLIRHPNREFFCLDLVTIVEPPPGDGATPDVRGDAGPALDARAKEAYAARLEDLRDRLAEAEDHGDRARAARIQAEIDALADELSRAVGLGGRDRRVGSAIEKARINVQRRLKDAIARIEEHDPALAAYLEARLKTGTYCVFAPISH